MNFQEFAKEILPAVQAAAEGKPIQQFFEGKWRDKGEGSGGFHLDRIYRVKPEPQLRPYTKQEWEGVIRVRCKRSKAAVTIEQVNDDFLRIYNTSYGFVEAMKYFENLDGSPCGMPVEEENATSSSG